MLSLETTSPWSAATVTVTIGAGIDIYAHTGQPSAYHAAVDFTAWCNDAARPWVGVALFLWTWAQGANGGAVISFSVSGPPAATWAPNLDWGALMMSATVTAATWTGTDGADGTSAPFRGLSTRGAQGPAFWSVERALQFSGDDGDASAVQSVRPFVPGLAGSSPTVRAQGSVADAARLTAIAATARNPRRLAVYQAHGARWIELAAGAVLVDAIAPKIFRLSVTAAGSSL